MAMKNFFTKLKSKFRKDSPPDFPQELDQNQAVDDLARDLAADTPDQPPARALSPKDAGQKSLEKLEKLEKGFGNMVGHLEGIDNHLKSFPEFVRSQGRLNQQLFDYIKANAEKEERLIQAVENLPQATARANRKLLWGFVGIIFGVFLFVALMIGILIYLR